MAPKVSIDVDTCDFCGTCVAVCAADAIELKESTVTIDPVLCTRCLACVYACPLGAAKAVK